MFVHRRASTSPQDETRSDSASQCSVPKDDQLVHMPSAHEPQPFAYPGYSDAQIKAYEHYQHKARSTSNEGYDCRLNRSSLAIPPGAFESYDVLDDDQDLWTVNRTASQHFQPYRHRDITVRKRNHLGQPKEWHEVVQVPQMQVVDTTVGLQMQHAAPSSPPLTSSDIRAVFASATGEQRSRKAFAWALEAPPHAIDDVSRERHGKEALHSKPTYSGLVRRQSGGASANDLRVLPRIRQGREPLAERLDRHDGRQCSFGCQKATSDGQCLERRNASSGTVIRRKSYVADEIETGPQPHSQSTTIAEIALGIFYSLLAYIQAIPVPKSAQIETLMSPVASTKAKAEALKAVLSIAAHGVAVCTILAVIWRLGAATMQLLDVLLWPLLVPLKILMWIGNSG